jgi:hypothetical protein
MTDYDDDAEEARRATKLGTDLILDIMSNPKLVEAIADFSRRLYLALLDKGFNEEEAMAIVLSAKLPAVK